MIPLIGYAPDLNSTLPGVLTNCVSYIPSTRGMVSAPAPVTGKITSALAAACIGAILVRKLDGTYRFFAGTTTNLYEAATTSWTDVSRAVGGAYTGGVETRWRFAQFGNVTLATNKSDTVQFSSSGAFANITGGIKAAIVETVGDYIIACDTDEATFGDSTNRWWVTPNYADWTPSIANRIASGILTSAAAGINAARRFGDNVIIYKDRSMYIGTFTGPPTIFEAREIPGEIGAPSQEAVAVVGTHLEPKHIFMGVDDFYIFDGARPIPIGLPIKETVFRELNRTYIKRTTTLHDRQNSRVYFYYPSANGGGALDRCVVYNYRTDKWGRDDRSIEAVADFIAPGYTYDDMGTLFSTYGTDIPIPYDSSFWGSSGTFLPTIFNSSHVLQHLSGVSGTCSITLGDIGDEVVAQTMQRVQPRWLRKPSSATCTNYYRDEIGVTLVEDQTVSESSGRFDILRTAKWHRAKIQTIGDSEISDMRIDLAPEGKP